MLLRFSATNNLSLRNRQELSLIASSLHDVEMGLLKSAAVPRVKILPAVVIYGANASGKTNVIYSLRDMRSLVLFSHSKSNPDENLKRIPFALDPACANEPTKFDIDFVIDGIRYHYGFDFSNDVINSEWLYTYPKSRRKTMFEREGMTFKFGRELKGRNRVISDLTRSNSLFISAAAQNGHKQLSILASYFGSMRIDNEIDVPGGMVSAYIEANQDLDSRVIELLHKLDTGVIDFRSKEAEVPEQVQVFRKALSSALVELGSMDEVGEENKTQRLIELGHRAHGDDVVFFELTRESAGTRRLLLLLGRVFRVLDEGALMLVDELDASLHTQACEAVLALFSSPRTNPKGAQMIASTHDNNLLNSPLLRRDQIWFTEKDCEGSTQLYPLTDIKTRNMDNIEKGYLQGRYGAVPYSGSISDLIAAS